MTLNELFTSIANAIRNKKGTSSTIKPNNFATNILQISTGDESGYVQNTNYDALLNGNYGYFPSETCEQLMTGNYQIGGN
jgi:hypothetical protein